MSTTHHIIPIPAYEQEGMLMYPQHYRHQLQGAIVELHFMLMHWSIGAKPGKSQQRVDTYSAELFSMGVFKKPLPSIPSPQK
jgi:hypothetical protein